MIELQTYFTKRDRTNTQGIAYAQISMNERAYIYKKVIISNNKTSYLVFIRMESNYLNRVIFPEPEDFGFWAFEMGTRDEAIKKFQELSCPVMIQLNKNNI